MKKQERRKNEPRRGGLGFILQFYLVLFIFNFLRGGLGYLFLVWTWSNKTCKFSQGTDELDMKLSKWGSFFKPIFIFNEASFFLDVEFKFLSSLAIFSQGTDTTKHVKFPFQTNIHLISTRHPFLLATSQVFFFYKKKQIKVHLKDIFFLACSCKIIMQFFKSIFQFFTGNIIVKVYYLTRCDHRWSCLS
jgi:hypothetical protein